MRRNAADRRFLDRKTLARFALLDRDGNGLIEWNDYLIDAQSFLQMLGVQEDSADGKALIQAYRSRWTELVNAADTDHDGRISPQEFAAFMASSATRSSHAIRDAIIQVADSDEDGQISQEEFHSVYMLVRGTEEQAQEAFRLLDADGDGFVSREELWKALEQYYTSADQAAWGNQVFNR